MASSPTTDRAALGRTPSPPAGSTAEIMLVISALLIGVVVVAGTFAPELLPWANGVVNDVADRLGIDF